MTTNNNRYFAIIFYAGGIALMLAVTLFLLTGCNTEKRAVKKSDKHFFKAVAWDKANVHGRCSDIAPPIVMTKDSFIYKPGKVIYKQGEPVYVEVDCDSVTKSRNSAHSTGKANYIKIKCPPCDSVRVDTAYVSVRNTEVDRNKEIAQAATIKKQDAKIARLEHARDVWRIIAAIATAIILLWIVIKWFWK